MRSTLILLLSLLPLLYAHGQIPLPVAGGPLPSDGQSHGFGAADFALQPADLAAFDYVEEEYILSGAAAVYAWPEPGQLLEQSPPTAYSTRLLVRRPRDVDAFSGTVILEPLNPVYQFDLNSGWALSAPHLLRNGDVWVGVTAKPSSVVSLITFDPTRYGVLDWSNPLPVKDPANCPVSGSDSQYTENGLVWDILRQTARWLRSDDSANPLRYGSAASRVSHLLGWGYGESGSLWHTYINALHAQDLALLGADLFDGYLIGASFTPAPINQCAEPISADDPRFRIRNPGVPVIRVLTQSDVLRWVALGPRQLDDRATNSFYRLYEIAGAAHASAEDLYASARPEDIRMSGRSVPPMACNEGPRSRFPNQLAFSAALHHLDRWVRKIADPPHGEPIQVSDGRFVVDDDGNVRGGVRSPYVDVPVSTWVETSTGGGGCALAGHEVAFSKDRLETLFASNSAYVRAVQADLNRHLRTGFLLPEDATRVIEDARLTPVP